MTLETRPKAKVPPRWIVRTAWAVHRGLYRISGGRFGLRRAKGNRWGMMHVTTIGRRSGQPRSVILGYFRDGPNLCTLAMNGWGEGNPAWWLNLQANPEATVVTADGEFKVSTRAASGHEREYLWDQWRHFDKHLDTNAASRSTETAVVILSPVVGTDT